MTEFTYGDEALDLTGSVSATPLRGIPEVKIGDEAVESDTTEYVDPYDDVDTSMFSSYDASDWREGADDPYGMEDAADAGKYVCRPPNLPHLKEDPGRYGEHVVVTRGGKEYVYPIVRDRMGRETILAEPIDVIPTRPASPARPRGTTTYSKAETAEARPSYPNAGDDRGAATVELGSNLGVTDRQEDAPLAALWGGAEPSAQGQANTTDRPEAVPGVVDSAAVDLAEEPLSRPAADPQVAAVAPVGSVPAGTAADQSPSPVLVRDTAALPIRTAVDMPQETRGLVSQERSASETSQVEQAEAVLLVVSGVTDAYLDGRPYEDDRAGVFVPTPSDHLMDTLLAAEPQPGERYMDIGGGDARNAITAGAVLGMEAVSCERSPERHQLAQTALSRAVAEGAITPEQAGRVRLTERNFFDMDLRGIDVFSYTDGSGPDMQHVAEQLVREGDAGARVIVYGASEQTFPGLELIASRTMSRLSPARVRVYKIVKE